MKLQCSVSLLFPLLGFFALEAEAGSNTTPPPAEMLWPAGTERQRAATWCRRFLRAGGLQ